MRNSVYPGNTVMDSSAPVGWKEELEAFWEEIRPRLEVYLRSFSGLGFEDAQEVLQKTLLEFWSRGSKLEADASSWLYRVARNAAIDALREGRRRRSRIIPESTSVPYGTADLPSPYPGPEARLLDLEQEAFVSSFLASLHDRNRELLHLAFAENFTYPDIASLTKRPLGTVKWKIAALKRQLAARYRKEFD